MLFNALVLASLTTTAFIIVYKKLPRRVRKWIERHSLFADIVALLLTYMLLGGTLTALIAAALAGIFVSALLYIANHPEDFKYLEDFSQAIGSILKSLQTNLTEMGQQYNESKQLETLEKTNG